MTPLCSDTNKDEQSQKSPISDVMKTAVAEAKVTKTSEILWENLILPKGMNKRQSFIAKLHCKA